MIVFEDKEVEFNCDDATGKLIIRIPVRTVLDKLAGKNLKVEYQSGYSSKEEVEREYFPKLSAVNFHMWLVMNFEQTKTHKRSLNVYAKLLSDLLQLAEKYGVWQLNDAILKCNTPEKCTIAYLCAILKNNKLKENGKNAGRDSHQNIPAVVGKDGNYQASLAEAVNRFM